jgi:hypothetical protein
MHEPLTHVWLKFERKVNLWPFTEFNDLVADGDALEEIQYVTRLESSQWTKRLHSNTEKYEPSDCDLNVPEGGIISGSVEGRYVTIRKLLDSVC